MWWWANCGQIWCVKWMYAGVPMSKQFEKELWVFPSQFYWGCWLQCRSLVLWMAGEVVARWEVGREDRNVEQVKFHQQFQLISVFTVSDGIYCVRHHFSWCLWSFLGSWARADRAESYLRFGRGRGVQTIWRLLSDLFDSMWTGRVSFVWG